MKLTNTKDVHLRGIKLLVYGDAGTGKTTMIGTCPGKQLILSAESGLMPLRGKDIDVLEITSAAMLDEAYDYLRGPDHDYEWLCLDSITEIAEVVLQEALPKYNDPRKAYGELTSTLSRTLRKFRDIPDRNVYFTCKQERMKDEDSGQIFYGPSMPGRQLGPQLPYIFDEVFCLRMERDKNGEVVRYLQTQPDERYQAKDRSGVLDLHEPPSLKTVTDKIKGANNATASVQQRKR